MAEKKKRKVRDPRRFSTEFGISGEKLITLGAFDPILKEVSRDISDPDYLAYMQAQRSLYAGTGYAEDALGSRPTFDETNGALLRSSTTAGMCQTTQFW